MAKRRSVPRKKVTVTLSTLDRNHELTETFATGASLTAGDVRVQFDGHKIKVSKGNQMTYSPNSFSIHPHPNPEYQHMELEIEWPET